VSGERGRTVPAYRVIDADGHVQDGYAIDWATALPEPYRAAAPRVLEFDTGGGRLFMEGRLWSRAYRAGHRTQDADILDHHLARRGMFDPEVRLQHMDAEGIDVAVLFGALIVLGNVGLEDAGLALALCQTYHDWLARFCARDQARLKGVAGLPLQDPPAAARELRRAVEELGFVAAVLPTNVGGKNLDHPDFDPVYAEAARLGVPICVHGSQGIQGIPAAGTDRFDNFFFTNLIGFPFELMIAVACVTCGGVMDRFPSLKFAFLEGGAGWLPFWLDRMTEHYERLGSQVAARQTPREYAARETFFISVEPDESTIPYLAQSIGADHLLFASDYWHWDAKFPDSVRAVTRREDLSEDAKRQILWDTPARLYGIE
jgi:predicted TIM-barrel fold metal-dependent hydrolase